MMGIAVPGRVVLLLIVLGALVGCGAGSSGGAPGAQPASPASAVTPTGASGPAVPSGGAAASASPSGSGADTGRAQVARPVQTLQVAVTEPGDIAWILYSIAEDAGIAASEGYSVQLVSATTNVAIPAILNGDMGYTAQVGSVMRAAARGLDLRVVAIFKDAPLQSLLVRPDIQRASDLIGRSVGVSTSGATAHLATVAMLEALGVPEDRVDWVFLGGQSARFAALDQGLVQGAAIVPPLDIKAERDQGYRILVRAADVVKIPFVGLATSTTRIREKPDEIKGLIRVVLRTVQFVRERPEEADAVAMQLLKLEDRELARRSMDQLRAVLTPNGAPDPSGFQNELATIGRLSDMPSAPRVEEVTDFRLLQEVQREMGLPASGAGS
jgi:ABC-type nitrate/sulfonate/bicarbonate transport system substrate-binding protein